MTTAEQLWSSAHRFGLAKVDRSIATWIRRYVEADTSDWITAENALMRILLDLATVAPEDLIPADGESDVVANTLARALGNCDRPAKYSTDYLKTLSALAFAAAGNFPSASVLARLARYNASPGPFERWTMSVLANPRLSLSEARPPSGFIPYARLADRALETGLQEDIDEATTALNLATKESFRAMPRTDRYLLLFWRQIHGRFEELSAARLLRAIQFPNNAYISELVKSSPLFYPSQVRTLLEQPLTRPGQAVFITLPTSTGKSLLGEIALVSSLTWEHSHWLAVYLAPYRALTDQLQERMRRRLRGISIRCTIRRGGYLSDTPIIEAGFPTVLVATPEAFDALLRQRPDLYEHLAACVFDEFHLIEQQERGLRYEGLLGRLLSGAAGEEWPKIVALSAVVQETENTTRWLHTDEGNVARLPWVPTSRRLAVVDPQGRLEYFSPSESLLDATSTEDVIWSGHLDLPHRITELSAEWYLRDFDRRRITDNVIQVALDQWERFKQPILVLASSRTQTRIMARAIASQLPQVEKHSKASQLAHLIRSRFSYLHTLQECLIHKVAYHNASLPDQVRGRLERLIKERELRIVAATTTLAEGVDLPFRVVVLADWRQWLFGQRQPMPTLLFRNIAGRCGRAWEFVEGDTIIVDRPDRELADYSSRRQRYMELYVNPPPYALHSSLEKEFRSNSGQISVGTRAVLESQFTAHVAICNESEDIESRFTHSLYAGLQDDVARHIHSTMVEFTDYVTTEPNYPVMTRQSPLQLTGFGEVVLRTGLSPRSGIALAYLIQDFAPPQEPGTGSQVRRKYGIAWEAIIAALWDKINRDRDVQELEGRTRQQIGTRGHPVTLDNFLLVAMAWVSAVPIEIISFLTFRGKTDERNQIQLWLDNVDRTLTSGFEESIEQVAVFCNQYLAEQWSWVLRGAATIAEEHMDDPEFALEINTVATRLKCGVKHIATANLLQRRDCPIDRAKLDWLVESFQMFTFRRDEVLDMIQLLEWLRSNEDWLRDHRFTPFAGIRIKPEDIDDLKHFLQVEINRDQRRENWW